MTGVNPKFWRDKKVFLTGHTGFKGSWMGAWLTRWRARNRIFTCAGDDTEPFRAAAEGIRKPGGRSSRP